MFIEEIHFLLKWSKNQNGSDRWWVIGIYQWTKAVEEEEDHWLIWWFFVIWRKKIKERNKSSQKQLSSLLQHEFLYDAFPLRVWSKQEQKPTKNLLNQQYIYIFSRPKQQAASSWEASVCLFARAHRLTHRCALSEADASYSSSPEWK